MSRSTGFFVIGSAIMLLMSSGHSVVAAWYDSGLTVDWKKSPYACSAGSTPNASACSAGSAGRTVAVCYTDNPEHWPDDTVQGDCKGHNAWCAYKDVALQPPYDGSMPGTVYGCQ